MHKVYITLVFLFCLTASYGQAGIWTWVNGDTTIGAPPAFGTKGIPSIANHPFGTYEGCEWTDKQGNFWFFESGLASGWDNDLWKYNPATNMWTWVKGNGVENDTGSYGIQGVPSPTNLPPCRGFGIASWTDTSGNLWMYGGFNSISNGGQNNTFNDMWRYEISTNEWTWIQGAKMPNQPPVHGTKGVSSPLNTPGARSEAVCTWVDNSNNLWLFGGASPDGDAYNDLWRYSIVTNQWTWMNGADSINAIGVYGTKGLEDPFNTPSGRWAYSRWKDNSGNFWLYGGNRYWSGAYYLNDMWKYNVVTNNWTWVKGPNDLPLDTGKTGMTCETDTAFNPISRYENRSCWKDNNGNFWMFGGSSLNLAALGYALWLNDTWMYNVAANEWTLVWSDTAYNTHGNFGIKGVASPCNKPLGRMGSVSWYDTNTNSMYLFGGYQYEIPGSGRCRSILWKYEIDTTCSIYSCSNTTIDETQNLNGLLIYPNPTSSTLTVSFEATSEQKVELLIYNIVGELVYLNGTTAAAGMFTQEISVRMLSNGIYFLQLQTKNATLNRKILKE